MWRYKGGVSKLAPLLVVVIVCLIIVATIRLFSHPELPAVEFTPKTDMPANLQFIIETTVIDQPEEGIVYRTITKEYSDSDAKGLAKVFGLSDGISYSNDQNEWLVYQNGEMLIVNGERGSWLYRNLLACQNKYYTNVVLPTDEEVVNLAKEYVTGLDIETSIFSVPTVGVTLKEEKVLQKSVYFYQDIDGYELLGVPQLVVDIGHNGELEGITSNNYAFEKYNTFTLKAIEQVITELQSQQAQYNGPETVLGKGVVYDISLAYCQSLDISSQQTYLVPVFLFAGEVETETGPSRFRAWVPAVRGLTISN
jgi:hypothetical protein